MNRTLWIISKVVSNAMTVLNSVRCEDGNEKPLSLEEQSLIVEKVNSKVSGFMLDSMHDLVASASLRPAGRYCERLDCDYYIRNNINKLTVGQHNNKCSECNHNQKAKNGDMDHFEG